MKSERNQLKAGLFIIFSVVLAMMIIFSIRGVGRVFEPVHRLAVSFRLSDDLSGLRVGDDVRLGGFKVGAVEAIRVEHTRAPAVAAERAEQPPSTLPATTQATTEPAATRPAGAPDDGVRLVVEFTLPSRYNVHEDAHIGIQSTITGAASLNIDYLGQGRAIESAQFVLVGRPSPFNTLLTSIGEASPELPPLVRKVSATVGNVNQTVTDVRTQLLPKLGETVTTYKDAGANVRDLFGDTKTDFRTTIANLKDSTATIREKLPAAMDNANKLLMQLNGTIEETKGSLEDIKAAIANTKDITGTVRGVVGGNKSKLDSMIASLKTTGDNLKAASSEIRRSPWRLLYKPGAGEVANLNLYDSARQFAEGAGSLSDAAGALRDALAHKDADPKEIQRLMEKLDKSFANFNDVEDKLWQSVKE